jgi:hypothetical protein
MSSERRWLKLTLEEVVTSHRVDLTSSAAQQADLLATPVSRARKYLTLSLRESGLLYGSPTQATSEGGSPGQQLFRAVITSLCRVGLNIGSRVSQSTEPGAEHLLLLLAAMTGHIDEADKIHRYLESSKSKKGAALSDKLWIQLEDTLKSRATSLTGDPYFGLVLHNGALFSDAYLFGRLALSYFSTQTFSPERARRRFEFAAQQKALLTRVLIGLACAERRPAFSARRAIIRQIEDLDLPADVSGPLLRFAKSAFERPPSIKQSLAQVRSAELKRFIVQQALLASLVDGSRSAKEVAFLTALASQLNIPAADRQRWELEVAEFYAKHRHVIDVFTVSDGAQMMGEEWVESMQMTLTKNWSSLLKEAKETRDLSVLLKRVATGQKLSGDEKQRMREQLIDVAKAVPALAIFAAPGGVLLLIALAKVLPFSILPSSFQKRDDEEKYEI